MKSCKPVLMVFLIFLSGCCSLNSSGKQIKSLEGSLGALSHKFELARKENINLKEELLLFKKNQDIDTRRFVMAQDTFSKELSAGDDGDSVSVEITDKGLIICILSEKLFVSASDALSDQGRAFLDKITALINSEFPNNFIYIEGYTDNQSLAVFEWKSDWEFSFARALSVLKYFTEKKGFDPLRLSASGFGQYRPRALNETKAGRRLNRRIEIVVSPQKLRHAKTL